MTFTFGALTTTTTDTLSLPAGVANGDVLLAFWNLTAVGSASITAPSGWTAINNQTTSTVLSAIWYRVASSEPSSYTWTTDGTLKSRVGAMLSIKNNDHSSPLDVHATQLDSTATANHTTPSVTPTKDGELLIAAVMRHDTTTGAWTPSWPAGWTSRGTALSDSSIHPLIGIGSKVQTTAASESVTVGTTSGSNFLGATYLLAIKPSIKTIAGASGSMALAGSAQAATVKVMASATGSMTLAGSVKAVAHVPPTRVGQRSGAVLDPIVTLRLHTPMPGAVALVPLEFATPETTMTIQTSVERGYESCQIGFPSRTSQERGAMAWLPEPAHQYRAFGHTEVADGARLLFQGRASSRPQYVGGDIRAVTALGYFDALNDDYFHSDDATLTTSDVIIAAILAQLTPYVQLGTWETLSTSHAPSEYDGQRGGAAIDSLVKEGSANGVAYDLRFWDGPNGEITADLIARLAPALPDYECDWVADPNIVNVNPDYSQLFGHVAVTYTPSGGTATTTDWQPDPSDASFADVWGVTRRIVLNGGQMTAPGAEQWRDTQQAMLSQAQWAGTIRVSADYPMDYAGTGIEAIRRDVRAGQWLRLRGLDPLLLIQKTTWDAMADTLSLTVTSGLPQRSLQDRIVQTMSAVREQRNPLSGAPNPSS